MNKTIPLIIFTLSATAIAAEQQRNQYNPHSYGSPQLYYSPEAKQEREEQQLLRESNQIAKERLEVERERLRQEQRNTSPNTYGR